MFGLSYFLGRRFFGDDGSKNYLIFELVLEQLKPRTMVNYKRTSERKAKTLSKLKTATAANNNLIPCMNFYNNFKIELKFDGTCNNQNKINFYSWRSRQCVHYL